MVDLTGSSRTATSPDPTLSLRDRWRRWRNARLSDPAFQARSTAFAPTRWLANRQGRQLYDLVAGFVYSQVLLALVELDLLEAMLTEPLTTAEIADRAGLPTDGVDRLVAAGTALGLLEVSADGRVWCGPQGAALLGAPGVVEMVRHHPMFYRDLTDPLALLRQEKTDTELSAFWSYVAGDRRNEKVAAAYSRLMAASQAMVAAETLAVCPLSDVTCLMDVGGGEGAFLSQALTAFPTLTGIVFDLPPVAERATAAFQRSGLGERAYAVGGDFLTDAWPDGVDAISFVRVFYDHSETTVRSLLARAHEELPTGGRVIVSEPMSGGDQPNRWGDAYFGLYTAAMTSGTPRSPKAHVSMLRDAGFRQARVLKSRQPFITKVVVAVK